MFAQLLREDRVIIDLKAKDKEEVLQELLSVLNLKPEQEKIVLEQLKKREAIGSTGVGRGVAIPHTRSVVVDDVQLVVGVSKGGIDFQSLDGKPVHLFFLLIAPPQDLGARYLITLGEIANVARKVVSTKEYLNFETSKELMEYLMKIYREA
ncbi:MAG TPA: PTS sugar transporter subunit IIA [Candidatus Hydrothermia bacterium]|nr:PTS sugar transporter subunit IIA [Candidatus Hydrothermae bacterium]MDD3649420.1 PTS sugar transporter subunit IIA [Candidatus Hydrothermia bacterium]MDD5573038.1 PTS sugar transporter subunit IIA [Candidatus Hydrothermia bacterium]HOK22862.1 PTS sugar transporter subunit IIA [Candidatus Hydrothermia bacterium]HOL23571.1 PTS sugar transporter subunit IIA [Candidatus Hydrothermia bacterium]